MPLFDVGSPAYQGPTTVGTAASVKLWSGTVSALAGISPAVTVRDVMIQNTGTAVLYVSSGTQSINTAVTAGVAVPVGAVLVLQGWTATTNTTTNDVYGIGGVATGATTAVAGLGTLISAV